METQTVLYVTDIKENWKLKAMELKSQGYECVIFPSPNPIVSGFQWDRNFKIWYSNENFSNFSTQNWDEMKQKLIHLTKDRWTNIVKEFTDGIPL